MRPVLESFQVYDIIPVPEFWREEEGEEMCGYCGEFPIEDGEEMCWKCKELDEE